MISLIAFFVGFIMGGLVNSYKTKGNDEYSLPPIQPKKKNN